MGQDPLPLVKLASLADVPHALPYQGSKRLLAHAIVRLIPADTEVLVEPFAGSAAISIAARYGRFVSNTVINDINEPLARLWAELLRDPIGLADHYEHLWLEQLTDPKAYYLTVREKFNSQREPHLLLYLLARCVKAAVRYSKSGQFNQSADNRRLGAKPATMRERICRTSATMAGTTVHSGDYADLLLQAPDNSVVYMDPPYQGVTNVRDHRYMRGLPRAAFESVLGAAISLGKSFIISYDAIRDDAKYGLPLSPDLGLLHIHLAAGRSSQATLQGLDTTTIESLYLSPALVDRLGGFGQARERLVCGREPDILSA